MYTILLVTHSIIVVFLIGMILIQRTDSDGMGGLGGGGGNQFLSGRTTANLMTRTTAILAGGFMLTSITLAVMAGHSVSTSIVDSVPVEQNAPMEAAKDKAPEAEKAAPKVETPAVPKPE